MSTPDKKKRSMKVQINEITSVKKSLTIEIPEEVVSKAFSKAYANLGRQVKVPGFRPGKVPLYLLEKKYGPSVTEDIMRELVPDYYQKAVEETGIFPVEFPSFDKIEPKRGEALSFTATVEVKPVITISDYKGVVVPLMETIVTDADVDGALTAKQEQHAQLETCLEDHEIVSDDFAIIDFEGALHGKPIQDGKQAGYTIQIGSKAFPPPFEDELLGKKQGDVFDLSIPYPEDFQNKAIAGKSIDFHIEIQEIKKKVLPALDDEFAKDLEHETLEELKAKTRETLEAEAKHKQEHDQKKALMDKLIEANPFDIPAALVAHELKTIMGSFPDQQGMSEDSEKKEALMRELEPLARHRAAESLILTQIAEQEDIAVGDAAVEAELEAISKRRGATLKEVKKMFYQKEGALEGLKSQMKESQVLDLIYAQAKFEAVAEVAADTAKGEKA